MKKQDALLAVEYDASNFSSLPLEFKKDRDVLLTALDEDCSYIWEVLPYFRDDKQVIMHALSLPLGTSFIEKVSPRLRKDPDLALRALEVFKEVTVIHAFHKSLLNDKAFVVKFLTQAKTLLGDKLNFSIGYLSKEVRKDADTVLKVLALLVDSERGHGFSSVCPKLKADKKFIAKAMQLDPEVYLDATASVRKDRALAVQAITASGMCLKGSPFRSDKAMVKLALKTSVHAFQYASTRLRKDRDLARQVFSENGFLLNKFPEWQGDKDMVEVAYRNNYIAMGFSSKELRLDKSFMLKAIEFNPSLGYYLDESLSEDMAFMLRCGAFRYWSCPVHRYTSRL